MPERHAAIVLAAGGSRRLGQPKQLLRRDGETLVARAVRLAAASGASRVLVMLGGAGEAVRGALLMQDGPIELHVVADWHDGLSASLVAAAQALHAHRGPVLVMTVDQPAVELGHLHRLLAGARGAASGCAAAVHDGRPGVPAVLSAALFARAGTLRGDRGFGALLAALPTGTLFRLDAPELERDVDTPEDLQGARACGVLDPDL